MKRNEIKKLDKLWSTQVKVKAGFKCEVCLEEDVYLNSCHIIGRRYRATRWGAWIDGKYDLCGFSGCYGCHRKYDEHAPEEDFIRRVVIGEVRYQKIVEAAKHKVTKYQNFEEIWGWLSATVPSVKE